MFSIIKVLVEEAKKKAEPHAEVADVRTIKKRKPAVVPPRPRPVRPTRYVEVADIRMTTVYGPVNVESETVEVVDPNISLYACPVIDTRKDKSIIVPGSVIGKKGGKGGR